MAKRKLADREPPETTQMRLGEMRYVPALSGPRKRMPWDKIDRFLATARAIVFNFFVLVAMLAIIGFTISEVRRDVVVIDPIRLPDSLRQMGYSEDVAAHRLWDEVVRINESTPTAKDRVTLLPASQQMDFEAPGAGVSLQAVVHMLRTFFDLDETRIAGEFICSTSACEPEGLALRLRVFRGDGMKILSLPPIGERAGEAEINQYFHTAAIELLRELDPYVVAFFLYRTDKEAARHEALQLIAPSHPQRKWALNLLGFIAAYSNDYDGAIGWYQRAIAADEDDEFAIAYNNWGVALRAKGEPDGAIEKYRRAIGIDSKNVLAYSNWGTALLDKGKFDGAIKKFRRAVEIDPENVLAYSNWGTALVYKGDLDEASVKFTLAIEIDPESGFPYNLWGNALYDTGDFDGAIVKYSHATEVDPKDSLAYYNWGLALDAKDERNEAIAKYRRATELDENDAGAYTNWGIALHKNSDFEGAIARFMSAAAIEPDNAFIYNNWGAALGDLDELDRAVEKFERAIELDSRYANAHLNKAVALRYLDRAGDAADAFQIYLDLRPDAGNAEWVRAQIEELRASAPKG